VPGVVKRDVETVNVDVAVPFADSVTLLGLIETVGHTRTKPDDEIDALRVAVPDSPFRLVRVIVDESELPQMIVREAGEAPISKSGGGGGGGGALTVTVWDLVEVSPPESIACATTV
jgi:hypothetical protein